MPNNDLKIIELHKQNASLQDKIRFMYIATATASIGFISTQIKDLTFSYLNLLPFLSIAIFGLSFLAGSKSLEHLMELMRINAKTLQTQINLTVKTENEQKKMISKFKQQKRCITLGAITYVGWLLLRMLEL